VFDFRQKDVFKFAAADVKEIRVKAGDLVWQAGRDESGWLLKTPVAARADKGKIDALLEALSALKAKAFVAETKTPAAVKDFGLEKPGYEVALSLPSESREIVFALSRKGDASYATTSQSTKIITFEDTVLADLDRQIEELRDRKVAEFYSWDANRIALKRGGVEIAAVKEKTGDTEKWLLEGPAKEEATGPRSRTSSATSKASRPPHSSTARPSGRLWPGHGGGDPDPVQRHAGSGKGDRPFRRDRGRGGQAGRGPKRGPGVPFPGRCRVPSGLAQGSQGLESRAAGAGRRRFR